MNPLLHQSPITNHQSPITNHLILFFLLSFLVPIPLFSQYYVNRAWVQIDSQVERNLFERALKRFSQGENLFSARSNNNISPPKAAENVACKAGLFTSDFTI
jgi:hypothetical protein